MEDDKMGELIILSEYRQNKDDEYIRLMMSDLEQQMSDLYEDPEMLYYVFLDMGICPCCGQHLPEEE